MNVHWSWGDKYEAAKDYLARRRSVRSTTHPTNLPFWSTEPDAPSTVKNGVRSKAESLNGLRYTEMVVKGVLGGEGGILRSLRSSGFEDILVLEDGAPSHCAAVAKAARAEMGIETLDHPAPLPS
ncbi:hypothetical protein AYX13_05498 [Cryptococcus neoformans]|nr:hypothetical protein AYX13_05498 [Cryptococcus neoformans var. grubii]